MVCVCVCVMQDLNKRQGLALLSKMGESVKYVTGGYKLRARPVEFVAMGDYLDMFTQKLGTIDRIAQRIIKEQTGESWKHHSLTLSLSHLLTHCRSVLHTTHSLTSSHGHSYTR